MSKKMDAVKSPIVLVGGIIAVMLISFGAVLMSTGESQTQVYGLITILSAPAIMTFLALLQGANTRADVRHDVRNEMVPVQANQQFVAEELVKKEEKEEKERTRLLEELKTIKSQIDGYAKEANGVNEKLRQLGMRRLSEPQQVEVVNKSDHPVPVVRPTDAGNESEQDAR